MLTSAHTHDTQRSTIEHQTFTNTNLSKLAFNCKISG